MPFTVSHAAAVLPVFGRGLPMSALVIGSMVPDLPYFVPLQVTATQTHSLVGVIGVDLMLGICAFVLWHLVLVPPLLWAAPEGLQRRIPDDLRGGVASRLASVADFGRLCLALIIGAFTHFLLDSFTHDGLWVPRAFPSLSTPVLGLQVTRWLHIVLSVVGLVVLAWFMLRWWRQAPTTGSARPVRPELRWGLAVGLLGLAAWSTAQLVVARLLPSGPVSPELLLVDSIVRFIATLLLGTFVAALVWHVWHVRRVVQEQRDRSSESS